MSVRFEAMQTTRKGATPQIKDRSPNVIRRFLRRGRALPSRRAIGRGAICVALLSGCAVGPDYQRPETAAPAGWRWKAAEPRDDRPRGPWWEIFENSTLTELEKRAALENLELEAAFHRVEQARALARIDRADFYPDIAVEPSFTRYRTSGHSPSPVPFPVPSFRQNQWTVPMDLSYEIDLWGRVRRSFEAARNEAFSAEAARRSLALTLQADVAAAYFEAETAEREMALLEEAIDLRTQALDIFASRLEAGVGNEFEVARARVEVAASRASLHAARRLQSQTINRLALLCGAVPAEFDVEFESGPMTIPTVAPGLPAEVLERRPDVAQAERDLAARMARIGVAKAAFFPSVRLTAAGGFLSGEAEDLFRWDSRVWSIGPSISLPVFAGGRNRAGLERARSAYEEGVALYRQTVLRAFSEVEDQLAALRSLGDEGEAREAAAAAARESAQLSLDRYRSGNVNFLEVIDAENVRLNHELAALRIRNEQRLATVRLIKALGGGWTDLEL